MLYVSMPRGPSFLAPQYLPPERGSCLPETSQQLLMLGQGLVHKQQQVVKYPGSVDLLGCLQGRIS